ncbi:hypothetical protein SUGI_1146910 [Cryptomeria japonica]|nr:hypothetical protein SUGI_1146910 [Cryptomeria japonica]
MCSCNCWVHPCVERASPTALKLQQWILEEEDGRQADSISNFLPHCGLNERQAVKREEVGLLIRISQSHLHSVSDRLSQCTKMLGSSNSLIQGGDIWHPYCICNCLDQGLLKI